jgi:uncharacterized protein YgiM (DUF1202 family)
MKTNYWLILGAMLATSVVAQNSNTLPEIPPPATAPAAEAPATPAPAPKAPVKKKAAPVHKAARLTEPTVSLVPGPAQVASPQINVRGQAGVKGELITHLKQGETVNVLEQINLAKHSADEPAQWAKIAFPANAHVWVNSKYIDAATKTVSVKKLNLRAGPGETYSVIGNLEHGTQVTEVEKKGNWTRIEPPANTYAFVAAMFLKQEAVAANPTPLPVQPDEPPQMPSGPPQVPPVQIDPNTPRVATHEGVVRHVASIITPTEYELYDPTTDNNINFLYATSTNVDFAKYVGMRITATGHESIAPRWSNTPVLTVDDVDKIQVIDAKAVPHNVVTSPRQQGLRGHR